MEVERQVVETHLILQVMLQFSVHVQNKQRIQCVRLKTVWKQFAQ